MLANDFQSLDFDLGETADMIRDTVRSFTADKIAPRAAEIDASNAFPRDLWPELGALGLLGITVEEEFGGVLFSLVNYARFIGVDPETALERVNRKFKSRFEYIEKNASRPLKDMTLEEMEVLWQEAKTH